MSDQQIENVTKEKFREMIKRKTRILVVKHLSELKVKYSKTTNLDTSKLKTAEYLANTFQTKMRFHWNGFELKHIFAKEYTDYFMLVLGNL